MVLKELDPAGVSVRGARRLRQHNYIAKGLGVSPTKDFQSQSQFSNHDDSRLIVASYVWGWGQNTLPRVK